MEVEVEVEVKVPTHTPVTAERLFLVIFYKVYNLFLQHKIISELFLTKILFPFAV